MMPPDFPGEPVPPVFIDNRGDVSVFRSVPDAETYIEAIDVQNREYDGFDSLGRLLELSTDGRFVHIALAERTPTHADQLTIVLRSFLHAVGDTVAEDSSYMLPQLVSHFTRYTIERPRGLWQTITSLFQTRP